MTRESDQKKQNEGREHYRSLNSFLREQFGEKVYKLALDGGFTCPTRDGSKGTGGCTFCAGGSGDFAIPVGDNVAEAIEMAKAVVADKGAKKFIAYFQSYTGTYAPIERLRNLYSKTIRHPDIAALSIGTRPDCLGDDVIELLSELNTEKPVWIELGLQTIHEQTARAIRRGYPLEVYDDAVRRLRTAGITVIVHMIIGLPGESVQIVGGRVLINGGNLKETGDYPSISNAGLASQPVELEGDIDTFTSRLWENLNEDNKVSLFVRYLDPVTGKAETRIVNKNA